MNGDMKQGKGESEADEKGYDKGKRRKVDREVWREGEKGLGANMCPICFGSILSKKKQVRII